MKRTAAVGLPLAAGAVVAMGLAARRVSDPGPLPPPPGELRDIRGERLHYIEQGSGPAVVLIHGFGGSTFSWRAVVPLLSPTFRVVALDLPGFGYSDRTPAFPLSHSAHAGRVLALMDDLGIETATLVGHSMGGAVAARTAASRPDRLDRLVLVASMDPSQPMRWREQPGRQLAMRLGAEAIGRFPPLLRIMVRRALEEMMVDRDQVTADVVHGYARPLLVPGTARCLATMMADTGAEPALELAAIRTPTLVVTGEHDTAIPASVGERLHNGIDSSRTIVVPRCGHLVPDEAPEALVEELLAFIHEPVSVS